MRLHMSSVALWLALATLSVLPARAGVWPNSPYTSLALTADANYKYDYHAIADGQGGLFMVWVEVFNSYDVFIQHVNASGQPLWGASGINLTNVVGAQTHPLPVLDGSGGLLVVWQDNRSGNNDFYAQRVNAAGVALWAANGVPVCNEASSQAYPFYTGFSFPVADGSGGFWFTWNDARTTNNDIYVQHVSATGVAQFTTTGVATGLSVCNATGEQIAPDLTADGAGGVFVAWTDNRTVGNADLYASHVSAAGVVTAGGATGTALCLATGSQSGVRLASDGMGGLLACWLDPRSTTNTALYAGRYTPSLGAIWTANGVAVCDAAGTRSYPQIVADGTTGAFLQWIDSRTSGSDMYAARLQGDGTAPWTLNGVLLRASSVAVQVPVNGFSMVADGSGGLWSGLGIQVSGYRSIVAMHLGATGSALIGGGGSVVGTAASGDRVTWVVETDGNGGALLSWWDNRGTSGIPQILANKVDRYNNLGSIEPTISGVRDVVGDQGGQVKLSWSASPFDVDPTFGIAQYRIWRSAPARTVASARVADRGTTSDADVASSTGALLLANGYAWEYLGTSPAGALPSYSYLAATTVDSVGTGNPRTAFMVEAQSSTSLGAPHWYSAPDSGYSVDNLPPAAPAQLTGQYAAGLSRLHWVRNAEADLAGYRLYRGTSLGFATDAAHRIAELPDTGAVDNAGAPFIYKVTAVDSHGNESFATTLLPSGTTGVGDGAARTLALAAPAPNPMRMRDAALVRFALPSPGRARVSLLDAQGREVRVLAQGEFAAGEHAVALASPASSTALAPGLYFVRLEAGGRALMRRWVVLE